MSNQTTVRPVRRRVAPVATEGAANRRAARLTAMLADDLAKQGHAQKLRFSDQQDLAQSLSRQLGVADDGWCPFGVQLSLSPEQVSDLAFHLAWDAGLARQLALLVADHTAQLNDQDHDEEHAQWLSEAATTWQAAFTLPPASQDEE